MNSEQIIGENLKKVRKANKLSQEQFAKIIGINRVTLAYIETNERKSNLSLEQLDVVSKFFLVPIETLIGDPEMIYIPVYGLNRADSIVIERFTRIIKNYQRICRLENRINPTIL